MNVVLNLTPTGMVPTRAMTPHVPLSVDEIVDDVRRCWEIGITMVHLHARDSKGRPTHQAEVYGRIIEGIRGFAPDLVVCVSLSGRDVQELEKRAEPLGLEGILKPDMGSLTLSSLNFASQASLNAPDTVKALASRMAERGIVPELEAFDLGMVNYAKYLADKGLIRPPFYANLFLGNVAGAQLDAVHAGAMIRDLPADTVWSLGGIGDAQAGANMFGIALGGGVRTGLEDALHMDASRAVLATNEELVGRVHRLAKETGRGIMRTAELRERLQLRRGYGEYGR